MIIMGALKLTQRNALANTDQYTSKNKNSDFVDWSKGLYEWSDDGNKTSNPHGPSPSEVIGLLTQLDLVVFWQMGRYVL